jgi:hypothetical protein
MEGNRMPVLLKKEGRADRMAIYRKKFKCATGTDKVPFVSVVDKYLVRSSTTLTAPDTTKEDMRKLLTNNAAEVKIATDESAQ